MATFINGELEVESGIPAGSQISYNGGSNRSAIGAYLMSNSSNPDGHFNGTIRELIVMNSLDEVQVSKIEGYLAHKWNFAEELPHSHPFKLNAPMRDPKFLNSFTHSSIDATQSIKLSNNGSLMYVSNSAANSISILDRNPITGEVSFNSKVEDENLLNNPSAIATSTNSPVTYIASSTSQTIASLKQNNPVRDNFYVLADGNWIGVLNSKFPSTDRNGNPVDHFLISGNGDDDNSLYSLDSKTGLLQNKVPFSLTQPGETHKIRVRHSTTKKYEISYDSGVFGSALKLPGFTRAETSGSADQLGILGSNARSVSLWMKAMAGNDEKSVVYGLGSYQTNSAWGLQGLFNGENLDRMNSFYHNSNDTFTHPSGFLRKWTHVVHTYNGNQVNIYLNGSLRGSFNKSSMKTESQYPFSFGGLGKTSTSYKNFVGLIDDVRIYSDALTLSDVQTLYGLGGGDFLIRPVITVDPILEGDFATGSVQFLLQNEVVDSPGLTENNFTLTNGSIDAGSLSTDDNLTWTFIFSADLENEPVKISIVPEIVADGYGETSLGSSVSSVKMYRDVTRAEDLAAWWSFDRDPLYSKLVRSDAKDRTYAVLYSAMVSNLGRFGNGLAFDKTKSDGRMKIDPNGIQLSSDGWTISAWCKNFIPPSAEGYSTLFRSQDKQADNDFDRYLTIRGSDRLLGFLDGDEESLNHRFKSGGYSFEPFDLQGWNLLTVVGDEKTTKYYLNGQFVAQASVADQSDVYYIGNSSNNELFAEYLDDVRIYGVSLSPNDVASIYGNGYGDGLLTPLVTETPTLADANRTFEITFAKDGVAYTEDGLLQNKHALGLDYGYVGSLEWQESNRSYLVSVLPDENKSLHHLSVPSKPLRFDDVSLWLDASDHLGHSNKEANLMLWLDAADGATFSEDTSAPEPTDGKNIEFWADKSGKAHHASPLTGTPTFKANGFNSLPCINLDDASLVVENSKVEFDGWEELTVIGAFYQPGDGHFDAMFGKLNYSGWMDTTKDVAWGVITHRQDGGFNLWGPVFITDAPSHAYENNLNKSLQGNDGGGPGLFTLSYKSGHLITKINGGELVRERSSLNGKIQEKPNLDFTIGGFSNGGGTISEMRVAEFLVYNSFLEDSDLKMVEGYLAHKWNLLEKLPQNNEWKTNQPYKSDGFIWSPADPFFTRSRHPVPLVTKACKLGKYPDQVLPH